MRSVKIESVKAAYNRVTAARVMNPATGHSKLVYCQHDPGSQLTFIASSLVEDLGLEPFDTASFKLDTLVGDKNTSANLVKFNIQSIDTEELFGDVTAAVIPPWVDDVETLPHKQDLSNLQHFDGVKLVTLDNCDTVDIIIGNDNAFLMCTKEERMEESRDEPHAIFTPLGWMASGGRSSLYARATKVLGEQTCVANDDLSQCKLDLEARDREIAASKGQLRDLAVQNEALDLSRTDEIAKGLVEPNVKLCNDHFEIPLPLKADIELPNNLALARNRAIALRKKTLKLFERIILSRLLFFIESNFLLSPRQAGFRPGRFTTIKFCSFLSPFRMGLINPGRALERFFLLSTLPKLSPLSGTFSTNLFRVASVLALLVVLNLSFLIGMLAWFFKTTKVVLFESVEVFRKNPFLALYFSLPLSMVFLLLRLLPSAVLFMLTVRLSGFLLPRSLVRSRSHKEL